MRRHPGAMAVPEMVLQVIRFTQVGYLTISTGRELHIQTRSLMDYGIGLRCQLQDGRALLSPGPAFAPVTFLSFISFFCMPGILPIAASALAASAALRVPQTPTATVPSGAQLCPLPIAFGHAWRGRAECAIYPVWATNGPRPQIASGLPRRLASRTEAAFWLGRDTATLVSSLSAHIASF